MDLIYYYGLFALSTAIAAHYELILPVLREVEILEPEDSLIKNKVVTNITAFILSILSAPILIIPTIIPSAGETFRRTLVQELVG